MYTNSPFVKTITEINVIFFFNVQGRCYLSAETLGEMKDWVSNLKAAIEKIHRTRVSVPDIPEVLTFAVKLLAWLKNKRDIPLKVEGAGGRGVQLGLCALRASWEGVGSTILLFIN